MLWVHGDKTLGCRCPRSTDTWAGPWRIRPRWQGGGKIGHCMFREEHEPRSGLHPFLNSINWPSFLSSIRFLSHSQTCPSGAHLKTGPLDHCPSIPLPSSLLLSTGSPLPFLSPLQAGQGSHEGCTSQGSKKFHIVKISGCLTLLLFLDLLAFSCRT